MIVQNIDKVLQGNSYQPFDNPITYHTERLDDTKTPRRTKPSTLFTLYYQFWLRVSANLSHDP